MVDKAVVMLHVFALLLVLDAIDERLLLHNAIQEAHDPHAIWPLLQRLHDPGDVIVTDCIIIINKGRIIACDTPEKLKSSILSIHTIEVSFDGGDNGRATELTAIPGCDSVRKQGDKFRLYTQEPQRVLPNLMTYAREHSLGIITLNMLKPRLEDVFLEMTAHTGEGSEQ